MNWLSSRLSSAQTLTQSITKNIISTVNTLASEENDSEIFQPEGQPIEDENGFLSPEESVGINPNLIEFVASLASHPKTFLDFPEEELLHFSEEMTSWQESHARFVLKKVPQLGDLRFQLVPGKIKDRKFWRIYFLLVRNKLSPRFVKWLDRSKIREQQKKEEKENKEAEGEEDPDSLFSTPKKLATSLFDSILTPTLSNSPSLREPDEENFTSPTKVRVGGITRLPVLGIPATEESEIEEFFEQKFGEAIQKSDSLPNSPYKDDSILPPELDNYFATREIDFSKDDYEEECEREVLASISHSPSIEVSLPKIELSHQIEKDDLDELVMKGEGEDEKKNE
eukprot:TRINITY_DN4015_c0_g1_i1.p1 TRINITY_DN4015_c0_g1~~TRINITY_DN4015_c0_g1_i1.p1  ORF type:complete len:350 (+),score=128.59 TRINITY_DN4015_c0_g1_i1:31-1050(+)